ncbi:MAG: COX15/CtaA family protein [Thermaurantiacus sp.]
MATVPAGFAVTRSIRSRPRAVAIWLLVVAALVLAMVIVGGITRLTESGLSITEWRPLTGAVPPLTSEGWQQEFDKYRDTAQYRMINRGMSLEEFRFIYFWEWVHRQLGRLIGLAFALPLAWFAVTRSIPTGYGPRLVALLALGGLQGAIGWWMVQSGLWTGVAVSHVRLAVHLLLALFILAGLVWTARDLLLLHRNPAARPARFILPAALVSVVLFVQLLLGAWVAGLRAGHAASDWPLMNGRWFPEGVGWHGSWLATVSSDPFLTHFLHRWWAFVAAGAILVLARLAVREGATPAAGALLTILAAQILLGILTVVSGVDITLAVLHQGVGALLVAAVAWTAHVVGEQRQRVRAAK